MTTLARTALSRTAQGMCVTDEVVLLLCQETAIRLRNYHQLDFQDIKAWTSGEANLDAYSPLACQCCTTAWNAMKPTDSQITISCEPPDISITFHCPTEGEIRKKIELKSSLKSVLPGSTIGKLDINQPLIYVLRPPKNGPQTYKVRYSQYHAAMQRSDYDLFQDRTPRPRLSFERMSEVQASISFVHEEKGSVTRHYAQCAINRISPASGVQHSWQDEMVQQIIDSYAGKRIRELERKNFTVGDT